MPSTDSSPTRTGRLLARLRTAGDAGKIRAESYLDAVAGALTGAVVYRVLAGDATGTSRLRADRLLDVIMS